MKPFFTPFKNLKGKKLDERITKKYKMAEKFGDAVSTGVRKLGLGGVPFLEDISDKAKDLAYKGMNLVGYENGGIIDGMKKGGKVRRKKVVKKQKQKQKQVVKQSVVVKVGSDVVKRRRAYKPREKQPQQAQPISISYAPTQQDTTQYEALQQQLKGLQRQAIQEIKESKKGLPVEEEEKKIKAVREQQQREYTQQIQKPEREFLRSFRSPLETSIPPTIVPEYKAPELKKGRGRPKSSVPLEERKAQYAEKQKQKRLEKKIQQVPMQETQPIKELSSKIGKTEKKKRIKFKIVDDVPPTEEQYMTALGGGAPATETGDD